VNLTFPLLPEILAAGIEPLTLDYGEIIEGRKKEKLRM